MKLNLKKLQKIKKKYIFFKNILKFKEMKLNLKKYQKMSKKS